MKKHTRDLLQELFLAHHREKFPNFPEYARPKQMFSDKTANGLTKCIINFLQWSGWQAERISVTGRRVDNTRIVSDVVGFQRKIGSVQYIKSAMTPGSADISATICGRSVKIEVKIGADRQSQVQKNYQLQVEKAGGIYIIAKDFESFLNWYDNFITE